MTKETLIKEAKEKAEKLEARQILGVYDNAEDLKYDEGYNEGQVAGYEEGYIAGAEPREKQIAHLEQSLLELAEKSVKRVANFEKENTELKEKGQNRCDECWKEHIKLTKAIDLLERCYYNNYIYVEPLRSMIKQFLKESKEQ